ncbi:MAG: putative quinol monooxygenase [Pseudomonadota bacterium]
MYVVTVNFVVHAERAGDFAKAVTQQAENSLRLEADCHTFDVLVASDDGTSFFLYEIYGSAAAFEAHLDSDHFKSFDRLVKPWVEAKTVGTWTRPGSSP